MHEGGIRYLKAHCATFQSFCFFDLDCATYVYYGSNRDCVLHYAGDVSCKQYFGPRFIDLNDCKPNTTTTIPDTSTTTMGNEPPLRTSLYYSFAFSRNSEFRESRLLT